MVARFGYMVSPCCLPQPTPPARPAASSSFLSSALDVKSWPPSPSCLQDTVSQGEAFMKDLVTTVVTHLHVGVHSQQLLQLPPAAAASCRMRAIYNW